MLATLMQTWKKLQAVLADILSEITLFWGYFESNILYFWVRIEEEQVMMENWGSIKQIWGRWMENGAFSNKIGVEWLWIEGRQSRFEDSIMPQQHLIHMFLFVVCRGSRYYEDIAKFLIFRLRTIYNFSQVWSTENTCKGRCQKHPEGGGVYFLGGV